MATGSTKEVRKPFASPFFLYFMFSLLCATLRWQWQGVLWTSVAALAIFVGLGIYSGVCLARSRLRAELLPHPQRVPRDRGGHAGLSQHLRRGGTHRARRAGGANGDHGGQAAPRARPPRWAAPIADRNRPATGNRGPPGRDGSPDRGWKPDPSKGCSRPSNAPSGLSSGNWSRTGRRRHGWPLGDCSPRGAGRPGRSSVPAWYRAWTPSMTASPRRLSGRSVISSRGPGRCRPARPHLQGAGAAWPASPMAALRERRAPGSEGVWRHPLGTKGSIVYCR